MSSHLFAARILEASARAYAGSAASLLLERQPDLIERYAPDAHDVWTSHLLERSLDLSAALETREPMLLVSRVRWSRRAFRARELDDTHLRDALGCLAETLADQLPPQGKDSVAAYLAAAMSTFDQPPIEDPDVIADHPRVRLMLGYLEACLRGDTRRACEMVMESLAAGLTVAELRELLTITQREAGRMWHTGEIAIVEEHLVTSTTERVMSILSDRAPRRESNGKTAIVAAVANNTHGLAVRLIADTFESAGWRAVCLGVDVPAIELAKSVVYFDGDLLALSVALPTQLKEVRTIVSAIRELDHREVKILLGGYAFEEVPQLWRELGADGSADSAELAVKLGADLCGLG